MKKTNNRVQVHTLGRFEIWLDGKNIGGSLSRSKKLRSLAAYLTLNHARPVTTSELFEVLWPNESSANPRNALKTLVFRLRAALIAGGAPEDMSFIIYQQGSCQWNPFLGTDYDFEQLCELHEQLQTEGLDDEERMTLLFQIVRLYQGHFLSGNENELWAAPQDAYLHNLYLLSVNELVSLYQKEGNHEEAVALCRTALRIDELDEGINSAMIVSLAAMGRQLEAAERYTQLTELYYTQLGIQLSDEMRDLYRRVISVENNARMDIDEICRQLEEPGEISGAFVCEFAVFRDLYRIEARCLDRYGGRIFLGLFTVTDDSGAELPLNQLNRTMEQLQALVVQRLRKGDIISRFSPSQLVLLLPTVTQETGTTVLERIVRAYRRAHTRSHVAIHYTIRPVQGS